ncbi:hypothetical protein BV898_02139 [Hypsibius exemplaris]|uniref:Putative auto-transporter adhesin head GIN domain-containing protein n=1 Tax=Hypsibius exemplaris TaxID=2072580 RepID=A0A1W0XA50_HYPEX|nr:hypothetical protein BV898_02139 [Hypsibius exemplaris]
MAASESRNVRGYYGVQASGSFQVTIDDNGREGLILQSSDANIFPLIETVVVNRILIVRFKTNNNLINAPVVSVRINVIECRSIESGGSSSFTVLQSLTGPAINLLSQGSSTIRLAVQGVNKLTATLQGSSVIRISGLAKTAQITAHGSSELKGLQLQLTSSKVTGRGSSTITIAVSSSVEGTVQGSAHLRLKGAPQDLEGKVREKCRVYVLLNKRAKQRLDRGPRFPRYINGPKWKNVVTIDEAWVYLTDVNGIRKIYYEFRGKWSPESWTNFWKDSHPKGVMFVAGVAPVKKTAIRFVKLESKINSEY